MLALFVVMFTSGLQKSSTSIKIFFRGRGSLNWSNGQNSHVFSAFLSPATRFWVASGKFESNSMEVVHCHLDDFWRVILDDSLLVCTLKSWNKFRCVGAKVGMALKVGFVALSLSLFLSVFAIISGTAPCVLPLRTV